MADSIKVRCPAGEAINFAAGPPGIRCRLSQESLRQDENARSINAFCCSDTVGPGYVDCPIWARFKKAEAEGGVAQRERLRRDVDRTAPDVQQPVKL